MNDIPIVAAIALLAWPVITLVFFAALGPVRGLIWSTLVGYLFLPERVGFDAPLLPPYTKESAIAYSLLLAAIFFWNRDDEEPAKLVNPGARALILLIALVLMISPLMTFLTNRGSVANSGAVLPGLGVSDFLVMFVEIVVALIPFFLARRWLATPERHTKFLLAVVMLGVGYSFLALFEIRMSPQLNNWFYGYFPHVWLQHLRGDGYRPLVFLDHGLSLGFYLFAATLAAVALIRALRGDQRMLAILGAALLLGTLLISRNLGALILTVLLVPLLFLATAKLQARVMALIAILFLSYPLMRDHAPIDAFTDTVGRFAPERAQSLSYRLENETALLDRANEKPVFGWGIWARAQIFNERGRNITTSDGTWIILLGEQGWIGYLTYFGLMASPLIMLRRTTRRKPLTPSTAALGLIAAGNLIYLIPNSTLTPVSWLIFGALAGYVERDLREKSDPVEAGDTEKKREVRYSRFDAKHRPDTALLRR